MPLYTIIVYFECRKLSDIQKYWHSLMDANNLAAVYRVFSVNKSVWPINSSDQIIMQEGVVESMWNIAQMWIMHGCKAFPLFLGLE